MLQQNLSKSKPTVTANSYLPYLDGLRGIAIIMVLMAHMGLGRVVPGGFGVSLFFFISGLLITSLLITEYNKENRISLKNFYLRRILRLYPALILFTLLSVGVLLLFGAKIHFLAILSSLFYFANYYYSYLKPPALNDFDDIFNIVWSLSIEEHFYLFFPVLFYAFHRRGNSLLYLLLTLCVAAFGYRYYLLYVATDMKEMVKVIYVVTETRADSIIWGCIAALLIYQKQSGWYLSILRSRWAIVLGLAIVICSAIFNNRVFSESFRFTRQSLAFMFIVPAIGYLAQGAIIRKVLENTVLVFIGKLSYSLYLFHWLAVTLANHFFKFASPTWLVFALGLSILLSLASYYLVERPFVKLRKKFGSHAR
jgi:peptidoglycan/LPS O-acetylase OafA/YrhL